MKTKRIKIPRLIIATRAEAEQVMNDLAAAENQKRQLTAKLDTAILDLEAQAAVGFARCNSEITCRANALEDWALANPQEFPKDRKSIDFLSGTIGFRTGTPKLSLLNRQWDWEKALNALASYLPNFIRARPEVDKEALIAQRDEEPIKLTLPKCGLKVTQEESFYVEPKLTDADKVK